MSVESNPNFPLTSNEFRQRSPIRAVDWISLVESGHYAYLAERQKITSTFFTNLFVPAVDHVEGSTSFDTLIDQGADVRYLNSEGSVSPGPTGIDQITHIVSPKNLRTGDEFDTFRFYAFGTDVVVFGRIYPGLQGATPIDFQLDLIGEDAEDSFEVTGDEESFPWVIKYRASRTENAEKANVRAIGVDGANIDVGDI